MEDFYINNDFDKIIEGIKFYNVDIKNSLQDINIVLKQTERNDFKLLCAIRRIVEEAVWGNLILNGNYSLLQDSLIADHYLLIDVLKDLFGFSEKYIFRLVRIVVKFIWNDVVPDVMGNEYHTVKYVFPQFEDMTISKFEVLLPLELDEIQKAFESGKISVKSTVKELRAYVKSITNPISSPLNTSSKDDSDNELEAAFDPRDDYTYEYFKSKCKLDLVDICLEYQRYVKRLTNKKRL